MLDSVGLVGEECVLIHLRAVRWDVDRHRHDFIQVEVPLVICSLRFWRVRLWNILKFKNLRLKEHLEDRRAGGRGQHFKHPWQTKIYAVKSGRRSSIIWYYLEFWHPSDQISSIIGYAGFNQVLIVVSACSGRLLSPFFCVSIFSSLLFYHVWVLSCWGVRNTWRKGARETVRLPNNSMDRQSAALIRHDISWLLFVGGFSLLSLCCWFIVIQHFCVVWCGSLFLTTVTGP